jgi:hypothetical protein
MVDLPSFFFSSCNCFCVVACEKKKNKEKNLNSCGLLYCSFISQQHTFFVFVFLDCQKRQDQRCNTDRTTKKAFPKTMLNTLFFISNGCLKTKREKKRSSRHHHTTVAPLLLFFDATPDIRHHTRHQASHQTSGITPDIRHHISHNKKKRSPNRTIN